MSYRCLPSKPKRDLLPPLQPSDTMASTRSVMDENPADKPVHEKCRGLLTSTHAMLWMCVRRAFCRPAVTRPAIKPGGWKTMPFIIGNEVCDKLATIGLSLSMILYLTQEFHFDLVSAANVLSISNGTAYITPVIGGYLADSYLGRFLTLIIASIFNLLVASNHVPTLLELISSTKRLQRAKCPSKATQIGIPFYKYEVPAGSMLKDLVKVCNAAFHKRSLKMPEDPNILFNPPLGDVQMGEKILHTHHFSFLDKAAVLTEGDIAADGSVLRPWRICTVHQVEQLKLVLRTCPIMIATMLHVLVVSQQGSFVVLQANTMQRHVFGSFKRIGIGHIMQITAMVLSGIVEGQRRRIARERGLVDKPGEAVPMSVFWLVPQLSIMGLGEAFNGVGVTEFFYDQVPDGMRSTVGSLNSGISGVGVYISAMILTAMQKLSRRRGNGEGWLENNLNRGHLDRFYYFIAAQIAITLMYFLLCSTWYTYKNMATAATREDPYQIQLKVMEEPITQSQD